jgi:hypothetical protein
MRFTQHYKTNYGGTCRRISEVLARVDRIRDELAGFCEGDLSHMRLERVSVDLAAMIVTDDDGPFSLGKTSPSLLTLVRVVQSCP